MKKKEKTTFSKKLLIADYVILCLLIAAFLYLAIIGVDTTNIAVIIAAWIAQLAISSGAYYWKSKGENLVKMPLYLMQALPSDMRDNADPNTIISAVFGMGVNQ